MSKSPEQLIDTNRATNRSEVVRELGIFTAKTLIAASTLGGVLVGAINYARSQTDEVRQEFANDSAQLATQAIIDSKVAFCSTGGDLIITFNNVSVDPLRAEAAGIKEYTGDIARSLPTTTTETTIITDEVPAEEGQPTPSEEMEQAPPTSALKPEGSNEALSAPCPAPPTTTTSTTLLPFVVAPPETVPGQEQMAAELQPTIPLPPQG